MRKLLFFMMFMIALASFGKQGGFKFFQLWRLEKSLKEENHLLAEKNKVLLQEISNLKDSRYLQHTIREELGYARQDELLYEQTLDSPQTP